MLSICRHRCPQQAHCQRHNHKLIWNTDKLPDVIKTIMSEAEIRDNDKKYILHPCNPVKVQEHPFSVYWTRADKYAKYSIKILKQCRYFLCDNLTCISVTLTLYRTYLHATRVFSEKAINIDIDILASSAKFFLSNNAHIHQPRQVVWHGLQFK